VGARAGRHHPFVAEKNWGKDLFPSGWRISSPWWHLAPAFWLGAPYSGPWVRGPDGKRSSSPETEDQGRFRRRGSPLPTRCERPRDQRKRKAKKIARRCVRPPRSPVSPGWRDEDVGARTPGSPSALLGGPFSSGRFRLARRLTPRKLQRRYYSETDMWAGPPGFRNQSIFPSGFQPDMMIEWALQRSMKGGFPFPEPSYNPRGSSRGTRRAGQDLSRKSKGQTVPSTPALPI